MRELITAVVEEQNLTTKYRYDFLKQIRQVTDDAGNETHVDYDKLGRRTVINNDDTGKTETVYDTASNVIRKITANLALTSKAIEYDYDHTRLIAIRYPDFADNNVTYVYGKNSADARDKNQIGRIIGVSHQAGLDNREYGKLGEVVKETRTVTVASPGNGPIPTYVTQFDFDTFGRLLNLTLPDGEVIVHKYDAGGNVQKITGLSQGKPYDYVKALQYDRFEQRRFLESGNGIQTRYTYNPDHRRLCRVEAGLTLAAETDCPQLPRLSDEQAMAAALESLPDTAPGQFQNLAYGYDHVGNILGQANKVAVPAQNDLGGPTQQTFGYDNLYRLTSANGSYTPSRRGQHEYRLAMRYDRSHNITHKDQESSFTRTGSEPRIETATTYDWGYDYTGAQPHAPTHIGNRSFTYDANGNQTGWTNDLNGGRRTITWDEENRIQQIGEPSNTLTFAYDDQGTRILKRGQHGQTVYVNQFFTVRNQALASKHIFAGTSRVATKVEPGAPIGRDTAPVSLTSTTLTTATTTTLSGQGSTVSTTTTAPTEKRSLVERVTAFFTPKDKPHPGKGLENRSDRANEVAQNTLKNPNLNGGFPGGEDKGNNGGGNGGGNGNPGGGTPGNGNPGGGTGGGGSGLLNGGEFLYFYHPDHLGSTSHVTDDAGELYEHLTYFPFGETWVQQSSNTYQRIPYRYTSKELDEETGLYYYGARYYDPRTSVWQSVDPILGKYLDGEPNGGVYRSINLSLFTYANHRPINLLDPNGLCSTDPEAPANTICQANDMLSVDQAGKDFIGNNEGQRLDVYRDTGELPTVGRGHLVRESDRTEESPLAIGDFISQERSDEFFDGDISSAESDVRTLVSDMLLSQDEFNALTDLVYNVGLTELNEENSPNLNAAIADRDYNAISDQLRYTRDATGNSPAGLITRSNERRALFRSE